MATTSIDTGPLRRALAMLREALDFWHVERWGQVLPFARQKARPDPVPSLALSTAERQLVREVVDAVIPGAEVCVFGSRATGRARPFSDLDLLFTRPARLTLTQRADLRHRFESSPLPYMVDLVEAAALAPGMATRVMSESRPL